MREYPLDVMVEMLLDNFEINTFENEYFRMNALGENDVLLIKHFRPFPIYSSTNMPQLPYPLYLLTKYYGRLS